MVCIGHYLLEILNPCLHRIVDAIRARRPVAFVMPMSHVQITCEKNE